MCKNACLKGKLCKPHWFRKDLKISLGEGCAVSGAGNTSSCGLVISAAQKHIHLYNPVAQAALRYTCKARPGPYKTKTPTHTFNPTKSRQSSLHDPYRPVTISTAMQHCSCSITLRMLLNLVSKINYKVHTVLTLWQQKSLLPRKQIDLHCVELQLSLLTS